MTPEKLKILSKPEVLVQIVNSENENPAEYMLKNGQKVPHAAFIAEQIDLRQKAKRKLPAWYVANALFSKRALEQSSGQFAASLNFKMEGKGLLDLTCGLGVDAWYLSQFFEEVVALEPEPGRLILAKENFQRLACTNISLVEETAESFLRNYKGPSFDYIYIDPDRRDNAGNRKYALKELKPDLLSILADLKRVGQKAIVKLSPMMDFREGLRLIPGVEKVRIVAVQRECKAILYMIDLVGTQSEKPMIEAAFTIGDAQFELLKTQKPPKYSLAESSPEFEFIYEADVSVYLAGIASQAFNKWLGADNWKWMNGYALSSQYVSGFPGKTYKILESHPWKPGRLKKHLKAMNVKRVNYTGREAGLPMKEVIRRLGIPEGGNLYLIVTRSNDGKMIAILAERQDHQH